MDYRGTLIDISLFGALFDAKFTRNAIPGTQCALQVLDLNDALLLNVDGVIVHAEHNRVGIEFALMDDERQNKIRHITLLNLAPPSLVERTLPALLLKPPLFCS
jgi:hypothetical protein